MGWLLAVGQEVAGCIRCDFVFHRCYKRTYRVNNNNINTTYITTYVRSGRASGLPVISGPVHMRSSA